jgi:hypothetical protein
LRWLVVPLLVLFAAGCCPKCPDCPPAPISVSGPELDSAALLISINSNYERSVPNSEAIIFRSTGRGIQWHNDSDQLLTLTLGGAVSYVLPPKGYSTTYYVSETKKFPDNAPAGYFESIPYSILPVKADGAPDPPSFGVGP